MLWHNNDHINDFIIKFSGASYTFNAFLRITHIFQIEDLCEILQMKLNHRDAHPIILISIQSFQLSLRTLRSRNMFKDINQKKIVSTDMGSLTTY